MGRVYLPPSEPPAEQAESAAPSGGRVYLPPSTPPEPEVGDDGQSEDASAGPVEVTEPDAPTGGGVELTEPDAPVGTTELREPEPPAGVRAARPSVRDSKEDWVAYAQTQGWVGDPESTSKKVLIELYGQEN